MRKLIAATTLTAILAATPLHAADPRPRERDTPITRVVKLIKRLITNNELPTPPLP
ncbi:MAG TPA: hypothetical protein VND45_13920 [Thermoanaerobaculia bacterium]|jgi:hypothetical protein|nr:hypothetical protein [Thermoanaerobaculia bacterium]